VTERKSKKQVRDSLRSLKFLGYCRSQTPPGEGMTFEDMVNFAKFFLCNKTNTLWKSEVWNTYTQEEILIEYFSLRFNADEEARQEFETQMGMGEEDHTEVYDWLDRMVKENQEEMENKLENLPDKVSFSPGSTGEGRES